MTLEGAINFNETQDYIIYTMNSVSTGQYSFVMPKNITGTLNMLVDLHMKSSFDGVSSGLKTKEQLILEISEEYNKVKAKYADGMLVMPMIDEVMYQNAVNNADKQKMFDEVKKIGAITSELYKKLTDSGIEKQKIDQKIVIVEKNSDDEKFVVWLKEQMPNFVDGLLYSELDPVQEDVNPFTNSNSIFGPAVTEQLPVDNVAPSVPVSSGSIFDNPAPVPSVEPTPSVEPVSPVPSVAPVEPVSNSISSDNVDIFGKTADVHEVQSASSTNVFSPASTEVNISPEPVATATAVPTVEVPKPVESAALEGTTTFSAISDSATSESNVDVEKNVEHASKGFANLLILLVILVGVTFASIELGKFLYSVYGA